jgi:epoxyqueuosine reductase QueG
MTISSRLPEHLEAMQRLVDRCPTPAARKEFIITAHCCGAIEKEDTELLIQANQLETA